MTSLSMRAPVFAETGHFTCVPNALFDWVQPLLSLSAWSVLCVIVRRTRGWGKSSDAISYQQIKKATGLKSDATVAKALAELLSEECFGQSLICRQTPDDSLRRQGGTTCYVLNSRFEVEAVRDEEEKTTSSFEEGDRTSLENEAASSIIEVEAPRSSSFFEDTKERASSSRSPSNFRFDCAKQTRNQDESPPPVLPQTPIFKAVCAATQRDPTLVSPKMCAQLVACADRLAAAGYEAAQVELAAKRWPLATAPYPSQLLDNIQALLAARPASPRCSDPSVFDAPPHATHPSHAPRPVANASPRNGARTASGVSPSRFENAAERKGRKWAQWLDAIA